jgi:hypothetical protein
MTKSAKITTIALIGMFTVLSASDQRIASLGGNAGFWPGDDANIYAFPATLNNFNIAQVSGVGAGSTDHAASVLWGDGTKWGFSIDQESGKGDMMNLAWGNGSMGLIVGLSSTASDDGGSPATTTSSMGLDISFGMNQSFGELGVGFSTGSYDNGGDGDQPSSMGLWANVRRDQALWLFDKMLIEFEYGSSNSSDGMNASADAQTNMGLSVSSFTHLNIAEGTTALVASGFGYYSISNLLYSTDLSYSVIAFPGCTFAVESAMTDWATVRAGVTHTYYLLETVSTPGGDITYRGGAHEWDWSNGETSDNSTSWSFGLGFNYGSFNLDLDVTESLYTNPVQHMVGYAGLGEANATATMTYTW